MKKRSLKLGNSLQIDSKDKFEEEPKISMSKLINSKILFNLMLILNSYKLLFKTFIHDFVNIIRRVIGY